MYGSLERVRKTKISSINHSQGSFNKRSSKKEITKRRILKRIKAREFEEMGKVQRDESRSI